MRCLSPAPIWEVGQGPCRCLCGVAGDPQLCRGTLASPLLPQGRNLGWIILFGDGTEIRAMEPGTGMECVILTSGQRALPFLCELTRVPNTQVLVS